MAESDNEFVEMEKLRREVERIKSINDCPFRIEDLKRSLCDISMDDIKISEASIEEL